MKNDHLENKEFQNENIGIRWRVMEYCKVVTIVQKYILYIIFNIDISF